MAKKTIIVDPKRCTGRTTRMLVEVMHKVLQPESKIIFVRTLTYRHSVSLFSRLNEMLCATISARSVEASVHKLQIRVGDSRVLFINESNLYTELYMKGKEYKDSLVYIDHSVVDSLSEPVRETDPIEVKFTDSVDSFLDKCIDTLKRILYKVGK